MQGGMRQPMLLQDELAQTLGFVLVALVQLIGIEAVFGFFLQGAAQRNPLIAGGAEPQGEMPGWFGLVANFKQNPFERHFVYPHRAWLAAGIFQRNRLLEHQAPGPDHGSVFIDAGHAEA